MKKCTKCILGVIVAIVIMIAIVWSSFYYATNYKKTICDTSVSPDEKYELSLLAVGEPEWPFGSATGQLVLKDGKDTISKTLFELRNDGGMVNKYCWKVTWNEEYVWKLLFPEKSNLMNKLFCFLMEKKKDYSL